jgi:hypothetical protein
MKKVNFPFISTLDDKSLDILYADVCREINTRAEDKVVKRVQWVRQMCDRFLSHPNSTYMQIGEITVVSVYNRHSRHGGIGIGKSRPVNGDKYSPEVGVAVAFAKACCERVPDYI